MRRIIISCIAVGMLASCASGLETNPVKAELDPAEQPTYAVGDKFVWQTKEGQTTHEVVAIEGNNLFWKSSTGGAWTSDVNFAMPAIEWHDVSKGGFGIGDQTASQVTGSIFPLQVGNKMTLRVRGRSNQYPRGWDQIRHCDVASQERIAVPAGTFDTYKIVCVSDRRKLTFLYSPELQHIVYYHNHHITKGGEPQYLASYKRSESWADLQESFDSVLENLK